MHSLLSSGVQDLEPLSRMSGLKVETLVDCAQSLNLRQESATVSQLLTEQAHSIFAPAPALVFVQRDNRFEICGLVSHDESFTAQLRQKLELCATTLNAICRLVQDSGRPGSHRISAWQEVEGLEGFETLFCAPLRTAHGSGVLALLLEPGRCLTDADASLFGALASIGALALANAALHHTANSQASELQQLLDICADVGNASSLEEFLERFVVRAASFLGYRACFIALVEGGICRMRWASRDGLCRPMDVALDSMIVRRVLATKEPFWSDEIRKESDCDSSLLMRLHVDQFFAMPLLGANGESLGILGLMDRKDHTRISSEDVRRAKALAAQAAAALEAARNLDISERYRRRAETLVSFALELGSAVELEDLVKRFTSRSMELLESGVGFMALMRGPRPQTVLLHGAGPEQQTSSILNHLDRALESWIARSVGSATAIAGETFDLELARETGWRQVIVTPLLGSGNELLGLLGLVDCRRRSAADLELLQAMASHAAAALQNSQLFDRITRSSRQWAELFDSISDFVLLHDENQRVARVNRSLSDKLRKQPTELLGLPLRDLFSLPVNTPACPFCLDLRGEEFREEFRDPHTGNVYLVSSSRLRGALEETQQIVHVLKDVTASRRAERLYRELFDNIQEGAYFSTPEGRLIEVNDALVRMLGYDSREELLTVDIPSKLYVDPAQREVLKRALHQFGRLRNQEVALLRRDGSIIYVLENSFAIRDEGGQVVEYRGVLLDITEIKSVQSQLLREHDFNTQILNHTQSLIAVVDTAGLVSYANRRCCEVYTGGEGELVGSRLEAIVASSHRPVLRSALESTLNGKPVSNLELPLACGREFIGSFSVNLSPMRSGNGEVNSIVVVMTDITDVATLQAKLMHTEKMAAVGQLVSGVAHEVNNPLTAILGFADLLLENPELPVEVRDDLQVIVHEAQRTREIVQNLLSFARQTPPEKQPVDLNQVLRRTISLRFYDLSNHGIELEERFAQELPDVVGDAHQLQQVFLNILNNACDAVRETGRRGRIVVSTEQVAGSVEVRFRDNGTGITNADRIFDPFYTTKDIGKGTGLGLSICYGIVREHNGEIICFNNPNQEGATFCIRLPLLHVSKSELARAAANPL